MKAQLQALSQENTSAIIIVRRIQKLGFKSPEILRRHFEDVGEVKAVHVAHSTVKTMPRPVDGGARDTSYRQRPAALGFVVMCEEEAVQKILAEGSERTINDAKVLVQAFERHDDLDGKGSGSSGDENDGEASRRSAKRQGSVLGRGGGGGGSRRERVEESPLCPFCGSTIATSLGIRTCQVCKRGFVHVLADSYGSNFAPPHKMQRRAY